MSSENIVKVNLNLPDLPDDDYKFVYTEDYSNTLESYKHSCELSLECEKVEDGIVYLLLANIDEVHYLPTFHTYEDDLGNLEFVTEHHVNFTKNIKLCEHRLCLWYVGNRSVEEFKERLGGFNGSVDDHD